MCAAAALNLEDTLVGRRRKVVLVDRWRIERWREGVIPPNIHTRRSRRSRRGECQVYWEGIGAEESRERGTHTHDCSFLAPSYSSSSSSFRVAAAAIVPLCVDTHSRREEGRRKHEEARERVMERPE